MHSITRLFAGALVAILLAPVARADEGLYLRFGGGLGYIDEDVFSDIDFDLGYTGSAAIGYNWFFPENVADFRMELEAVYHNTEPNSLGTFPLDGRAELYGGMVNAYFDFRTIWVAVPYVGGGIGWVQVNYEDDGSGGAFATFDDDDTVFAYQAMAGFTKYLNDHLAVGVEYRYFEADRLSFRNSIGIESRPLYSHHSAMVNFILGF
ncbi:MAG: porin family protein [Inquilinus sp.]|nr:porin family protein [Inquilinus sp.]